MRPFLLILPLLAAGPALAAGAEVPVPAVEVVLSDFRFTPAALELKAGERVMLHFSNQGSGGHSFSAPDFFAAATIDPASAPLVAKGKVEVKKGASVDVTLVPAKGKYPLRCTHFLHGAFGMKGSIEVR